MIFLVMILVILVFVVLWNYDVHKILYVKSISQNAGDSAALAAARWQGITLNLIGDLNIMHAFALGVGNDAAGNEITDIQARLCYVGPMIGLMAAQQAAKQNKMYRNEAFDKEMSDHASEVKNNYSQIVGPGGQMLFPEPYPGCWDEYSDMLYMLADDGIAAGPDNAKYYNDYAGDHILLTPDFYDAISSQDWCWFFNNEPNLLEDYENFFPCWWDPLPPILSVACVNSEYFGLGLAKGVTSLSMLTDLETVSVIAQDRGLPAPATTAMTEVAVWYCYGSPWTKWESIAVAGDHDFPAAGTVKPQYDYAGADAAVRVEAPATRVTPGPSGSPTTNTVIWTAAAKPFGYLSESDPPTACSLVLPAFHDVRLIPIAASSTPAGGSYNIKWREHIENHLADYMVNGPQPSSCWYCQQLETWESPSFRAAGVSWLDQNSWMCNVQTPGGGPGGGVTIGH